MVGKPCVAQLTISLAESTSKAVDNALERWPTGLVPPSILTELARPSHFEEVAAGAAKDAIGVRVVCTDGAQPIVEAIERFVGAGYDTVYIHQIGPDQGRLVDLARSELLPHFGRP